VERPNGSAFVRGSDDNRFIEIQVCLQKGVIDQIAFGTYGCAPAIACGSWACEWAAGRPAVQVGELTAHMVLEGLGGLPPHREEHAHLTVQALQAAVSQALQDRS
jgi:NifU-like protein involved in Fe-S cluster formation